MLGLISWLCFKVCFVIDFLTTFMTALFLDSKIFFVGLWASLNCMYKIKYLRRFSLTPDCNTSLQFTMRQIFAVYFDTSFVLDSSLSKSELRPLPLKALKWWSYKKRRAEKVVEKSSRSNLLCLVTGLSRPWSFLWSNCLSFGGLLGTGYIICIVLTSSFIALLFYKQYIKFNKT